MATIGQLRKKAKDLGITPASIRKAKTAEDLQELIMDAVMNGGSSTTQVSRKSRPARKAATAKPVRRTSAKSAVKSKPAAQSATGKAKRSTADTDESGRNQITGVDFTKVSGWNAREGSAPDVIVSALRKFKGNRSKVFDALKPNIWDFVGRKMRDGSRRTMASAEEMLRYRISRTAWDFAMKTGQHQASTNRVEYGTGGTGNGSATKQVAKKRTKAAAKPQEARRGPGRPKGSRNTPKKAAAVSEAPKRRGRPPKKATAAPKKKVAPENEFRVTKKHKARA